MSKPSPGVTPAPGGGSEASAPTGPRLWQADAAAAAAGDGGPVRGEAGGAVRRQAKECNEYVEGGEKYLDCQGPTADQRECRAGPPTSTTCCCPATRYSCEPGPASRNHTSSMVRQADPSNGLSHLTTACITLQANRNPHGRQEVCLPLPSLTLPPPLNDRPWNCDCRPGEPGGHPEQVPDRNTGTTTPSCAEPPSLKAQS
ncbi:unnamed protein product [Gadus morhua 'NCC']